MTRRLPREDLERLFDAVCRVDAGPGADERHVARALYGLLAAGQPVNAPRLAAAVGVEPTRAQALLERLPNVERNDHGAVVGFGGLSLRPTVHRLVVDGHLRYAWCAWDTLFLPVALDAEAEVASRCGRTGRPVRLRVGPAGLLERDPGGVVLSFVHPDTVDAADLRGSFCGAVHFFADATAAAQWTAGAADVLILDLDDAFELGRRMIGDRCGPC